MHTRAKFYVSGLTLLPGKDQGITVNLTAVCRGDRNAEWARATPMGTLTMTINNPAAVQVWRDFMDSARETGKSPELFLDIVPSDDGWPGDGHAFRLADIEEGISGHNTCGECGMSKDRELTTYDSATRRSVPSGLVHPNG